jgi:predicted outer membrane repeat protein
MSKYLFSQHFLLMLLSALTPLASCAQSFCEPVSVDATSGAQVLGDGTPGSVSTAQIQAALDVGGAIRFNVGSAPHTIIVSTTLVASKATVLDGAGVLTLSGGSARRILRVINPNPAQNAPVFRVTLQNINFIDAAISDGRGAAIYKQHGAEFPGKVSIKLVNCRFVGNNAPLDASSQDDGGGAFYGELLDRLDIGNCVFENNSGSNGGALYSLGSKRVNIVDTTLQSNRAIGTGGNPGNGGNGGALAIDGAERIADLCRTRFIDNTSNAYGAGFFSVMYDQNSRSRFEDALFQGNRQLSSNEHTGGVYLQDGPWAIERSSFIANEANGFGGLFVTGNAPGVIRNSSFSGNIARTGLGGAMALSDSAPISIINSTIANNVATAAFGGGIVVSAVNQLRLSNVILANNTGGNRFVNWAITNPAQFDGGGNLQWPQTRPMGGGTETAATASAQFADPQLINIANNGGLTPTFAIPSTSPARDSGVNDAFVPSTDQRGFVRFGMVDRGAYEFAGSAVLFANGFE